MYTILYSIWRKEWVVPTALSKPAGAVPGLAERMGVDASTRSETPLRILKWVRTEQVAQYEEEPEVVEAAADAPPPETVP